MANEFFWLNEKYGMEEICWWYRKSMELPSSSRKGQIHHYTKGSLWNHIYKLGRALDWALSLLKSIIRSWEKFLSKNQAPETFFVVQWKNLGGQEFSSQYPALKHLWFRKQNMLQGSFYMQQRALHCWNILLVYCANNDTNTTKGTGGKRCMHGFITLKSEVTLVFVEEDLYGGTKSHCHALKFWCLEKFPCTLGKRGHH